MKNIEYQTGIEASIQRVKWLTDEIQASFNKAFEEEVDIEYKYFYTLDETLVPFLGWLDFRQYLRDKPHPFGLLVRVMALSQCRFIVKFELYVGKHNDLSNKVCDIVPRFILNVNTEHILSHYEIAHPTTPHSLVSHYILIPKITSLS